jgi:hypothetical protein
MRTGAAKNRGQSVSETVILMPLFLFLVLGLLQMGELGTALLIANYSASAVARQVVQDQVKMNSLQGSYLTRFKGLLSAGMRDPVLTAEYTEDGVFSEVTVRACAQITAFPFVGQFLTPALGSKYSGFDCSPSERTIGPFSFSGTAPYKFGVRGIASMRMNYQPR